MLVQDRDTQCQTDEAMTVYVRLACMAGMVMQQRNSIELLAEFRYRRIIDTERKTGSFCKAAGIRLQANCAVCRRREWLVTVSF